MHAVQPERRAKFRFNLQLPIVVSPNSDHPQLIGTTRNISAGGVLFYADSAVKLFADIHFRLLLPPELTGSCEVSVCCHGKVVRVEAAERDTMNIAAAIGSYEFE